MKGWIKLHRSIKDWEWYSDMILFRFFTHLLVSVNHQDKKWQGRVIEKGSLATSWSNIANDSGLTVAQVRRAADKMEESGEIVK